MKLPSLHYLVQNSKTSFKRFPLSLICSLIATCIGIYLIEQKSEIKNWFPYINLMLCAGIGIPLFFCASVLGAKKKFSLKKFLLLEALCLVLLVLIYFSLPGKDLTQNTAQPYIRYGIYNFITHLLVSIAPFAAAGQLNGFWNYNKTLFIRFLTAVLYSGFLYAGISLALVSLHLLFDIKIHEELYGDLFVLVGGFFNTWFFMSGIPKDFDELEQVTEYPRGLKIFAQYILFPLLVLYLIILYIYGGKILLLWDWPKGLVSYLIACVAVLGILTLLLLYPYGNKEENSWIKKVTKVYYFILIPLTVILFIAICMRLEDYGITVKRYVIFLLGIWLSVVSIYFIIGRKNIKFIPASLVVILALMSFGPWGMFSVSERSQIARLHCILEKAQIIKNDQVQNELMLSDTSFRNRMDEELIYTNDKLLSDSMHNEVRSILAYLDDYHGFSEMRHWFKQDINALVDKYKADSLTYISETEVYMSALGLDYNNYYNDSHNSRSFSTVQESSVNVSGYDYFANFSLYYNEYNKKLNPDSFIAGGKNYKLSLQRLEPNQLILSVGSDTAYFPLRDFALNLDKKYTSEINLKLLEEDLVLKKTTPNREIKLCFRDFNFELYTDTVKLSSLSGYLLIKELK